MGRKLKLNSSSQPAGQWRTKQATYTRIVDSIRREYDIVPHPKLPWAVYRDRELQALQVRDETKTAKLDTDLKRIRNK